jgi:hypothetical protein
VPRESAFPSTVVRQGNFEAAKAARRVQIKGFKGHSCSRPVRKCIRSEGNRFYSEGTKAIVQPTKEWPWLNTSPAIYTADKMMEEDSLILDFPIFCILKK